jgi:hypothetical protein
MFSGILLVVPLFKIITALGIYDTELALIITMVTQTLPTAVFMLRSYFDTIPDEIRRSRDDGRPEPPANHLPHHRAAGDLGSGVGLCLLLHGGVE